MVKDKKSRRKNYIAQVNGALFRHLIGRDMSALKEINVDSEENKFYYFSNSKMEHDPIEVLTKLQHHVKNSGNICFGVFQMKNCKEYYFVCEINTLYIDHNLTHISTKPVVNLSGIIK